LRGKNQEARIKNQDFARGQRVTPTGQKWRVDWFFYKQAAPMGQRKTFISVLKTMIYLKLYQI
jgi:hypothetical protein